MDLPQVVVQNADMTTVTGDAACALLNPAQQVLAAPLPDALTYAAMYSLAQSQVVLDPNNWGLLAVLPYALLKFNGLYSNPDNAYLASMLSRNRGAVAVLTGKLPTTPPTFQNDLTMQSGKKHALLVDVQL
ncbi:unnamed protein product [Candidatus Paraburkholderia kirkii UZHbot1]|uniref:WGS project CAFE00000000 data, contig bkir_c141 n=1 Tax=Candidatus Paraburkholderia kirkii UZHbot1 TaxID=1055526 RepID=U3UAH6_9BURK|nr:unnamed protein product [Candidatus Paraburkholderia kirkii UZHbot1]